jgi:hypothetical protein
MKNGWVIAPLYVVLNDNDEVIHVKHLGNRTLTRHVRQGRMRSTFWEAADQIDSRKPFEMSKLKDWLCELIWRK